MGSRPTALYTDGIAGGRGDNDDSYILVDIEPAEGFEWGQTRTGSDYLSLDLVDDDPESCRTACLDDPVCLAFTYVEPGIQGDAARCWLKDAAPNRTAVTGRASQVVRSGLELDTDRWGGGYSSPTTVDEVACRDACIDDTDCMSFTFRSSDARCFLKGSTPSPQGGHPGLTSGFVREDGLEYGVDRLGGDYANLWLDAPDPRLCQAACVDDLSCEAFTYIEPGIHGAQARCWLKDRVPATRSVTWAISGIVQRWVKK